MELTGAVTCRRCDIPSLSHDCQIRHETKISLKKNSNKSIRLGVLADMASFLSVCLTLLEKCYVGSKGNCRKRAGVTSSLAYGGAQRALIWRKTGPRMRVRGIQHSDESLIGD
jgi:hypothetical protein